MRETRGVWTFLVSLIVMSGCGGEEEASPVEEIASPEALAALARIPCDTGPSAGITDSTVARLLTGGTRLDAEVYDCQRLVLSTGATGEFGPLVGLYPVDATLQLARADFAVARPAAAIHSWGAAGGSYTEGYPGLAPAAGLSCVWLRNSSAAFDGWEAAIVGDRGCGDTASPPPDTAFTLPVFERVYPETGPSDYPRTARWEWDLNANRHFIGLKCGDAWCAVAGRGSAEPRTQPLQGGNAVPREKVPGWSDAQHLAVHDSAGGLVRPGPWASIVAYPGIAAESPPWTEGLLSARITVYGAAGAFADRFYLQPDGNSGYDDVILRFPGVQDEAWLQQGPMRRRQASRIQFAPSVDHAVVGTARWRWQEGGETIWIYCPSATCGVEP